RLLQGEAGELIADALDIYFWHDFISGALSGPPPCRIHIPPESPLHGEACLTPMHGDSRTAGLCGQCAPTSAARWAAANRGLGSTLRCRGCARAAFLFLRLVLDRLENAAQDAARALDRGGELAAGAQDG